MNNQDNKALAKALDVLTLALTDNIQLRARLKNRGFRKSADAGTVQYQYMRTEDLGQGVTRKILETFEVNAQNQLVLISAEVQDASQ